MRKTYPEEAEDGRDSLMVMDPERLKIFVDYMEKHPVGLVHSPLHSGKTTLGMRLQEHYLTHNYKAVYISLASYKSDTQDFDEYWKLKIGSSWTSIIRSLTRRRLSMVVLGSFGVL